MTNFDTMIKVVEAISDNLHLLKESNRFDEIDMCFVFTEDLNTWIECCESFQKNILVKEAQDECIKSIMLCTQGFYKEAFISLRQFLEHFLLAILLSTNDYNYRLWKDGKFDMCWASMMDNQNGVFSKSFINVYGKDIDTERSIELINLAKSVYRECSEYVHGNYGKLIQLSSELKFNEKAFESFIDYFSSVKYLVSMSLLIRYRDIFDDDITLKKLETIVLDNVGEITEVQYLYNKGVN